MDELTPKALSEAANISLPYAWQILNGKRNPSRSLALHIWKTVGRKFPPIAHLSDADIRALDRIEAKAA